MSLDRTKDYFVYCAYRVFNFLFLFLPKPLTRMILLFFSQLAYFLGGKRTRIAMANLDLIYGEKIRKERKKEIIKESYKTFLFNLYEFVENQKASKEEIFSKVKVINENIVINAIRQKRKIIYITAHYGGWEVGLPFLSLNYGETVVIGKDMENPFIQKKYMNSRLKNKIKMFSKNGAIRKIVKTMKDGLPLAMIIDQHIDKGCELYFMGKRTFFIDSASRLAFKFEAIIIPAFIKMNDFRDYTIEVCPPLDVREMKFQGKNKIQELTEIQAKIIEEHIFQDPGQWLWQHKRWKTYYNHIYEF